MAIYKVKLKRRQEIASGTMAFHFEKPQGFSYTAGQFGDVTLANPPETDTEGNTRTFTRGCWTTRSRLIRNSWRNFYPHDPGDSRDPPRFDVLMFAKSGLSIAVHTRSQGMTRFVRVARRDPSVEADHGDERGAA